MSGGSSSSAHHLADTKHDGFSRLGHSFFAQSGVLSSAFTCLHRAEHTLVSLVNQSELYINLRPLGLLVGTGPIFFPV